PHLRLRCGEQGRAGHPGGARRGARAHRRPGQAEACLRRRRAEAGRRRDGGGSESEVSGGDGEMKRGFEENVPRVRPRVRLGRTLDETGAETEGGAAEDAAPGEPQLELAPPAESDPAAEIGTAEPTPELPYPVASPPQPGTTAPDQMASRPQPIAPAAPPVQRIAPSQDVALPPRGPRRSAGAAQVAQLAKDLTAEVAHAAEANAQLRADLDAAVTALRRAAEEAREQRVETEHLAAELEKRGAAAEQLRREMELLEAER